MKACVSLRERFALTRICAIRAIAKVLEPSLKYIGQAESSVLGSMQDYMLRFDSISSK